MDLRVDDFWKLLQSSGLVSPARCAVLKARFEQLPGAESLRHPRGLAEWLVANRVISRYQARLLLAGRPGPFHFDRYCVYDRRNDDSLRALHLPTQHPVQLVFVTDARPVRAQDWALLRAAAQRHVAVNCPYVTECFEIIETDRYHFAVIEEVRGTKLTRWLEQEQPDETQIGHVLHDLAAALSHLHGVDLVHGMWHTDHVRVDAHGRAMLVQNPFAQEQPPDWERYGEQLPQWIGCAAPELIDSHQSTDRKTDLYSLGCLAYLMIERRLPYGEPNTFKELKARVAGPRIPAISTRVSDTLNELVHRMMAVGRERRFASADDVLRYLAKSPEYTPPVQAPVDRPATWPAYEQYLAERRKATEVEPHEHPLANLQLDSVPRPRHRVERPKPKSRVARNAVVGGISFAIFLAAAYYLVRSQTTPRSDDATAVGPVPAARDSGRDTPEVATDDGPVKRSPMADSVTTASTDDVLLGDDGGLARATLWASPTDGEPVDLAYTPRGAQMILSVRLSALLAADEGRRTVRALGPLLRDHQSSWEQATDIRWQDIERCVIAMLPRNDLSPDVVTIVELADGISLPVRWTESGMSTGTGVVHDDAGMSTWVPRAGERQILVRGPTSAVQQIIDANGTPPPLRLDLEKLHVHTDADRYANLLVTPNFLFRDGRGLFAGKYVNVLGPLSDLMRDDVQGVLLSCDWSADRGFYAELRLRPRLDVRTTQLADRMRNQVDELPSRVESYLTSLPRIDPHWRRLALRMGSMLRLLAQYTRIVHQSDHVVMNVVLPPAAPHNLVLATELALVEGDSSRTRSDMDGSQPVELDELLARRLSFSVDQQSLEFAIRDLAVQVNDGALGTAAPLEIRILGSDLQQAGITRNQQIRGFQMQNASLAEVLTGLVLRANPVTTARDASDPEQQLVWVPAPSDAYETTRVILITTRAAAAREGYRLPDVFGGSAGRAVP